MEKLVLRGIMYGADKIPDSWFDKVPGGYYKARAQDMRDRAERRRSDDYDDRDQYDRYDRSSDRRRDSHRSRSSRDRDDRRYDNRAQGGYDDYDDRYPQDRPEYRDDRRQEYPRARDEQEEISPEALRPADIAAGSFAAGVVAAEMKHEEKPQYSGYVPYANIYNSDASLDRSRGGAFSPPPRGSISSPQPNATNQISPPRRMSVVPDGSYSDSREHRYHDGNTDYGHDDRSSRVSRPRPSRMRSRSYDSYDSRDPARRYRNDRSDSAQSRGKSQSRLSTTFDKSKRGLGYGAVGALAGGLAGSELGGGVSTTIGAVLGGLGANMFEARERRKHVARDVEYARNDDMVAGRDRRERDRRDSRAGSSWID